MTVEQFSEITATRIPTPRELVQFVSAQGWRIAVAADGTAALKLRGQVTPLVTATARMIRREPYRTNVFAEARQRWEQPAPAATPADPAMRLRQWLWRFGHTYAELPIDWSAGHTDRHPAGSWWWRWQGEMQWQSVPGRPGAEHPIPEVA